MTQDRSATRQVGVAVIGFGWMGQVHARAYSRLLQHYPGAPLQPRLVAVADPEPSRRDLAVNAYGFEVAYADWAEVIARDDVAVVSVTGPNYVHAEIGVAVAKAGKHLWVEKPVGRHLADTTDVVDAVRSAGVRSAVGFNYRNVPAVALARDLITQGRLGRVETVTVRLLSDYAAHPDGMLSWRFDPALAGTGVIGDLASHGLDLARYVVGPVAGEISEVVADLATFITERPQPLDPAAPRSTTLAGGPLGPVGNEDHVSALLRFAGGARGVLESSRVAVGEQCTYGIEVHGDRGAVAWDFRRMGELRMCGVGPDGAFQDVAWHTRYVAPGDGELGAFQPGAGVAMGFDDLKVVEAERLLRSVAQQRPIGATIEDALATARTADALLRSAAERRWVSV
ncbi:MAG: Gfo/Idh/MocA family oxidoreductase [Actinomycetota bacterium]|nr:Gfo/Idh/MocA family oxidoreductase [Actinomycetota bacterium]